MSCQVFNFTLSFDHLDHDHSIYPSSCHSIMADPVDAAESATEQRVRVKVKREEQLLDLNP